VTHDQCSKGQDSRRLGRYLFDCQENENWYPLAVLLLDLGFVSAKVFSPEKTYADSSVMAN